MLIRRHARIAQSTEKKGVELIAEHLDRACRQGDAFPQVLVSAPIKFHKFDRTLGLPRDRLQHLYRFRSNSLADAISGNDGNSRGGATCAHRNSPAKFLIIHAMKTISG